MKIIVGDHQQTIIRLGFKITEEPLRSISFDVLDSHREPNFTRGKPEEGIRNPISFVYLGFLKVTESFIKGENTTKRERNGERDLSS